jgi:hypothetical protein
VALAQTLAGWPAAGAASRAIGLHIHAAVALGVDPDARPATVLASAAARIMAGAPALAAAAPTLPAAGMPPPGGGGVGRSRGFWQDEESPADAGAPAAEPAARGETEQAAVATTVATRCAGLFYLLDRVQELELAESLWEACLPEGAVLAAAMTALLGPDFADDPAPELFGGIDAVPGCPEVAAEQHAEVAAATCTALAAALPRRGLAETPPIVASLIAHPAGRLLVAAAEASPFAFFAWPAGSPDSLRAGLRVLLEAWPPDLTVTAAPALAGLDATGRLRPAREAVPGPLLLPAAPSATAAALLALVAGAPSMLFAVRAGETVRSAPAFVARYLVLDGLNRLAADEMTVIIDAEHIDIAPRRAGLDRDPGFLPWLRRSVRFVFAEG